ncbi:hypothetical protein ScPMuIL_003916 [Solemya velum]
MAEKGRVEAVGAETDEPDGGFRSMVASGMKQARKLLLRRDGNNTTGNEVETPAWPYRDCYNLNYPKRGLALVFAMKSFSG